MSNLCEKTLKSCIAADCTNPLFAGVDSEALIANYSDIASYTYDYNATTNPTGNPSIITGITMVEDTVDDVSTPRCFYCVQQLGNQPFNGSQTEFSEGTYGNRVNHTIQLAVVDNGPAITENIIDNLLNGKFVVILKNDYVHDNGDNKYQVFGSHKGLKCTGLTRELYGDNESAYIVTLQELNAPKSGMFFYVTDESTTDAAYDTLKCSCCNA